MIHEATPQDAPAIRAFLVPQVATSMFLLSNLEQHGIGGSDHPHATRFFLWDDGPALAGVFGCTNGGYLMCQHPGLNLHHACAYLAGIEGVTVQGMTGSADQVACFLDALPSLRRDLLINRVEPLFTLELAMLSAPTLRLEAPLPADRALLEDWFCTYLLETGFADAGSAPPQAAMRAAAAISEPGVRLLRGADGTPLGMTAVNARAGQTVQIGGVFVPPAHRRQGHASRMVAAQLSELRAKGVQSAILFVASDAAAKAYTRIGFQHAGSYRVALLRTPCTVRITTCP